MIDDKLIPEEKEYGSFYETYISYVRGKDPVELMLSQVNTLREYFVGITEEKAQLSYDDGKWTFKEVIGHINDTEKIMLYRALCIARNEKIKLPGYEQEEYVKAADFNRLPLTVLLDDFEQSRKLIVSFFKNLPEEALTRMGNANGYDLSVRALLNIIPGHFEHHMRILHERYGI